MIMVGMLLYLVTRKRAPVKDSDEEAISSAP